MTQGESIEELEENMGGHLSDDIVQDEYIKKLSKLPQHAFPIAN